MDSNLTVADAAKILGVSAPRVYQFCNDGKLGRKVDGAWVFSESELREFAAKPRRNGRPREKSINPR